jgi:hypothetical protein
MMKMTTEMTANGAFSKTAFLRAGVCALVFAAAAALSGCYESGDVSLHSPGVYKGKPDSAAVMSPSADARDALRARFRAGQTDR